MSGRNSAYSPLPQSNSDSDGSSEEELQVPQESRIVNRTTKTQNLKTEKSFKVQKPNVINYKPLDTDRDIGVTLVKFQSNADEVSILKPNNNSEIFSTTRKICFIFSLLLCVFTTVVFIWVLPCNVGSCLSSTNRRSVVSSWEKIFSGLEIYGPINIINESSGKNKNLLLLMKNPLDTVGEDRLFENEMVSLKGTNGEVLWRLKLNKITIDIDCNLVDLNLDGINDCLVVGGNFLKAIHPISGKELWDVNKKSTEKEAHFLKFPLVLPDVDGDQVKDLLTSCSFSNTSDHNYMVIISGKSGEIINQPLQIKWCSDVLNLMLENSSVVSYTCYNSTNKESLQTISLINLYDTINSTVKRKMSTVKWEAVKQHQEDSNTIYENGCRLTLRNFGHCPENCYTVVELKSDSQNKTLYGYTDKYAYGMTPVVMKLKGNNGFILKFWKWHSKKEKLNSQSNFPLEKPLPVIGPKGPNSTKESDITLKRSINLDTEMLMESQLEYKRCKRTSGGQSGNKSDKSFTESGKLNMRVITETLVAITVNGSHVVVNNISEDEVIQICRKGEMCRPNVYHQKRSLSVADLNRDGKEELICFTSKYVHETDKTSNQNNESWQFQSKIRVISF